MQVMLWTCITALLCSVFFAAYELAVMAMQSAKTPYHAFVPILSLYSIPFLFSLSSVLVLRFLLRERSDREARCFVVGTVSFYLLVFLGTLINIHLLPELTSPTSIAGNAAFLGLIASVAYGLYRWPLAGRPLRAAVALAVAALLAILVVIPATMVAPTPVQNASEAAAVTSQVGADAPNIALVLIDTLRADHLSGLGYPRNTTPNIDAYAQQGVVFEQAYSASNWTPPSIASIFTSLIPESHQSFGARQPLPLDKPTLTEVLKDNGYRTGIFADNPFVSSELGYARGADRFFQSRPLPFLNLLGIGTLLQRARIPALLKLAKFLAREETDYWDDGDDEIVLATAYRFIKESSAAPYFAYAHIVSPHAPYQPPADAWRPFCDDCQDPSLPEPIPMNDANVRALVDAYDGEIRYSDQIVGAFIERVLSVPSERDTLVIITSDHGESIGDHGNFSHGNSLYDEEIRVPLILILRGAIAPGRRIDVPVSGIDIFPTIVELTGITSTAQLQGRSLATIIADGKGSAEAVVSQHGRDDYSVIAGGYKLIKHATRDPQYELYRRDTDASEKFPSQDPATISALDGLLREILSEARQQRGHNGELQWLGRRGDRLKALGYVE